MPAGFNDIVMDQSQDIYAYKLYNTGFTLQKFDSDGTALWYKNIPANVEITSVKLDASNSLTILGNIETTIYIDGDSISPNGLASFFLLKFSPSGAIIQKQVFGGQKPCKAYALSFASNGDCFIGGGFTDSLSVNGHNMYGDSLLSPFFLRMNSSGIVLWSETATLYTASGEGFIHDIVETASGNLYVGFSMMGGLLDYNGYQISSSSGQYLCYLNSSRNIVSATFTTYFGMDHFYPRDLRTNGELAYMKNVWSHQGCSGEMNRWDPSGDHIQNSWIGHNIGYDIYNGKIYTALLSFGNCNVPTVNYRNFMLLTDSLAVINGWVDSLSVSSYGWYSGMEMIDTNSFYVIGYENGFGNFLGKYNLNLLTSTKEINNEFSIKIYPNPANDQLIVENISPDGENVSIYNSFGALVFRKTLRNMADIDISSFAPSVYLIQVSEKSKVFIKQ